MPACQALKRISSSYAFQLGLEGCLAPRLAYTTLYWRHYLAARWLGRADPLAAHGRAFEALARGGWSRKTARVRALGAIDLEVDLFTAFMILEEVYGRGIYDASPLGDFTPREGEVVFDVGSQQGTFALRAGWKVGPHGRVLAFEPEPANFARLRRNIEANAFHQVSAFETALSDREGESALFINPSNTAGHSLHAMDGALGRVTVRTTTLDAAAREQALTPSLIKIDVEGSSLAVLRGAMGVIGRCKPRIVLELDRLEDAAVVKDLLRPLGYAVACRDNNLFAAVPERMPG